MADIDQDQVVLREMHCFTAAHVDGLGYMAICDVGEDQHALGPFPSEEWAKRACQWLVQCLESVMNGTNIRVLKIGSEDPVN